MTDPITGGIVSGLLKLIFDKLGTPIFKEIERSFGVKSELERLRGTLSAIDAVLLDAEEQQTTNHTVRLWIENLKDVAHDIEDVLDLISTQALESKVHERSLTQRVREKLPDFSLAWKLKAICSRLEKISADRRDFNLQEQHLHLTPPAYTIGEREQASFVQESSIFGRKDVQDRIVSRLVSSSSSRHDNISEIPVLPIVGIGGLGKTTLAKLVFNDPRLHHFEIKLWASISTPNKFSNKIAIESIIQSATSESSSGMNLQALQNKLHHIVQGKAFLLVLDNVWLQDPREWVDFKEIIEVGSKSSRIIVTTREEWVASTVGTTKAYKLKPLSDDDCWSIFVKYAFKDGKETEFPWLVSTGKEIVKKCCGVPLAARTLGSLLSKHRDESYWRKIKESKLWEVEQAAADDILPALKLSFDQLPYILKACFSFCSSTITPNGEFEREDMVDRWMALGLIDSSEMNGTMEEIGTRYFNELVSRSFFEEFHRLVYLPSLRKNGICFKMHDLVHELGRYVTGDETAFVSFDRHEVSSRVKHLVWMKENDYKREFPCKILNAKKARSFQLDGHDGRGGFSTTFLVSLIGNFRCLRILSVTVTDLEYLPNSVGDLKHLRYLDLDGNYYLRRLPDSISKLVNLQTLSVRWCLRLEIFPGNLQRLLSLRNFRFTSKLDNALETCYHGWTSIRKITITHCSSLTSLPEKIGTLTTLRVLQILDCPYLTSLPDGIQLLIDLEHLEIADCRCLNLSEWEGLNGLTNLRVLILSRLPLLDHLPNGLQHCTSLLKLIVPHHLRLLALPRELHFSIEADSTSSSSFIGSSKRQLNTSLSMNFGVKSELERLNGTLSAIDAVLLDAEEQQTTNHSVRLWIENLKDIAHDIEDELDLISTQALENKFHDRTLARRVREKLPDFSLARKLKAICNRLEKISANRRDFNLQEHHLHLPPPADTIGEREQASFVQDLSTFGRKEDQDWIVSRLVSSSSHDNISEIPVIPIVGIGGLGKTTLAKLVFNDPRLHHFEIKLWASISTPNKFSKKIAIESIIQSATSESSTGLNLQALQNKLHHIVQGKAFLLVLDNVWLQDPREWVDFKEIIEVGSKCSRIIVTTREDRVASTVGTMEAYKLNPLSEDDCWSIFVKYAFRDGKETEFPWLVSTGKEIVKKCCGVPLAARTLGSLLSKHRDESYWRKIKESKLWEVEQAAADDILPALKLSFDQLPYILKACFSFCSTITTNGEFEREDMVDRWMALGLIDSSEKNGTMEEIGTRYFNELVSMSFFEAAPRIFRLYASKNDMFYQMHDLVHELGRYVTWEETAFVSFDRHEVSPRVKHLVWMEENDYEREIPCKILKAKKVRSFQWENDGRGAISTTFLFSLIGNFKCLRILSLTITGFGFNPMEYLPNSVGDLKHLRYLNLDRSYYLTRLPDSISKLVNLQTLSVRYCSLELFPENLHRLLSLRNIRFTSTLDSALETCYHGWTSIRKITITHCVFLTSLPEKIGTLTTLRVLKILCCLQLTSLPNSIQLLIALEHLEIEGCDRLNLSEWKGLYGLTNLRVLILSELPLLVHFPDGLQDCTSLLELIISRCDNLLALPRDISHIPIIKVNGSLYQEESR